MKQYTLADNFFPPNIPEVSRSAIRERRLVPYHARYNSSLTCLVHRVPAWYSRSDYCNVA
jgi:hypothetical protein